MSHVKKQSDNADLFPSSWVVGPNAAAELARGDDDVMVAPELSEEDLRPLSSGRSTTGQVSFDDIWEHPAETRVDSDRNDAADDDFPDGAPVEDTDVPTGMSATRDHDDSRVQPSGADETVMLHTDEPDSAEIDALWHDMDDLNARFDERERSTSRLRLEPTLSSASLEATATGPVGRAYAEPETASLGIRLAATAAVLLAIVAVGHRFDIPSAAFWEKTDRWVADQASSVVSRLGTLIAKD